MTFEPLREARVALRPSGRSIGWWLAFGFVVAVALGSTVLAYGDRLPAFVNEAPGADKVIHGVLAGALAICLDGALGHRNVSLRRRTVPLAPLLVLVPIALDEIAQRFSPFRTSSIADFAADSVGVFGGVWLLRRYVVTVSFVDSR